MFSIRNLYLQRSRNGRVPITFGAFVLCLGFSAVGYAQGVKMVPLNMPVLPAVQTSKLTGHASPTQVVNISVNFTLPQLTALKAYADSVSNPKSSNFRHFLTPAQVGQMFGASTAQVQAVESYLTQKGFTITLAPADHFNVLARGTVLQAEQAFSTTINQYHSTNPNEQGRVDFFAFSQTPQVPFTLSTAVASISGLENHSKPHLLLKHRPYSAPFNSIPLTPNQTRTLYDTAPIYNAGLQGQGRHVAISSWDGFRLTNVPLYYSEFGLPTPTGGVGSNITVVTVDGGSGAGTPAGEGDVDIQMILGMAPLANFTIYDGAGTDLINVLTKEANDNLADIISESYGWILPLSDVDAAHTIHLAMTAQGITYVAASGDQGTADPQTTFYPTIDGEVLMVGGTDATVSSAGNRVSEVAWSLVDGGGGGGGWGTFAAPCNVLPSWQKGFGVPTSIPYRLSPDVAFNAYGDTGAYQFFFNGSLATYIDGTSFASPVFAGMLTLGEQQAILLNGITTVNGVQRLGRLQDTIYAQNGRSDVYYDITSGNNGVLPNGNQSNATPGWDFTSGWGCIDINAFINSITETQINVVEAPSSAVAANAPTYPASWGGPYGSSGGYGQLGVADGSYFTVTSNPAASIGAVAVGALTFEVPQASSSILKMSLSETAVGNQAITNFVYMLNSTTGNYDLVYGAPLNGGSTPFTVTLTNPANYISTGVDALGNHTVTVIVRQVLPTRLGGTPFTMKLDSALLNYTYAIPNS